MRAFALALLLCLTAGSAFAALAPEYYAQARADAESVVVIEVTDVEGLPLWTGYGTCTVQGRIAMTERGSRLSAGSFISIGVPCKRARAEIPAGGVQWQDHAALRASRWGRAFLTPSGGLALSQYEILSAYP